MNEHGSRDPAQQSGLHSQTPQPKQNRPAASPPASTAPAPSTRIRFAQRRPAEPLPDYRNDEEQNQFAILESLGGGAGLIDFDRDARPDLVLPTGGRFEPAAEKSHPFSLSGRPTRLLRQTAPWIFVDVSQESGVSAADRRYSHGVAAGDVDADGFPDLLITGYGGVQFLHNQGDGTFRDGTDASGLVDPSWSSSACWADFNGDGHLDLYVAHYVNWSPENHPACADAKAAGRDVCSPRLFEGLPDALFFSQGDGTFRNVRDELELRQDGKGLGVIAGDFDLDGDVDLYVANDTVANFLYWNAGSGSLIEAGERSGTALSDRGIPDGSMGVSVADLDGDGRLDLFVANYEHESMAVYRALGMQLFQHSSRRFGVTALGSQYVGFGTAAADFDHDGDEDLFVSNGHVIRFPPSAPLRQKPLLLDNENGLRLTNAAPAIGGYFAAAHRGRGAALGDLDGDGDLDLVVTHLNAPPALLENLAPRAADSLRIRLVGRTSPRDGTGAVLALELGEEERPRQTLVRLAAAGGSYLSHALEGIHFGLPEGTEPKRLTVRWPSGRVQEVRGLKSGTLHILRE